MKRCTLIILLSIVSFVSMSVEIPIFIFDRLDNTLLCDIKSRLNDNEIFIDFANITNDSLQVVCYAFCIKSNYEEPHVIKMPPYPETVKTEGNAYQEQHDWFLSALQNELTEIKRIFFVPNESLAQTAIEYCMDNKGLMLSEEYEIYRLSSSKVFCSPNPKRQDMDFLLCAGIDYHAKHAKLQQEKFVRHSHKSNLGYLNDSYSAVKMIVDELSQKSVNTYLLDKDLATEYEFSNLVTANYNVLLLETHGIFTNIDNITTKKESNDPLDNHALAFASASYVMEGGILPDSIDDGWLTAKEISRLDLSNIDLAVISACKSGLGDVKWDGVHGLMRGFKLAGVNSLVMTLDDVVDYVSGQLWIQFFRNLTNGQSKRESLLNGIKYIRTMDDGFYSHPKYWTPFILIDGIE